MDRINGKIISVVWGSWWIHIFIICLVWIWFVTVDVVRAQCHGRRGRLIRSAQWTLEKQGGWPIDPRATYLLTSAEHETSILKKVITFKVDVQYMQQHPYWFVNIIYISNKNTFFFIYILHIWKQVIWRKDAPPSQPEIEFHQEVCAHPVLYRRAIIYNTRFFFIYIYISSCSSSDTQRVVQRFDPLPRSFFSLLYTATTV